MNKPISLEAVFWASKTKMQLDELCSCHPDDRDTCMKCNGVGFVLTEQGQQMLLFLKRHFVAYNKITFPPMKKVDNV